MGVLMVLGLLGGAECTAFPLDTPRIGKTLRRFSRVFQAGFFGGFVARNW